MANLREAFEFAAKNPNSQTAKDLKSLAESGSLNVEAKKFGIDLSGFQQPKIASASAQTLVQEKPKASVPEKILQFTGGDTIAKGLGQGVAMGETKKMLDQTQKGQGEQQQKLIQAIRANKAVGHDTTRLEQALKDLTGGITDTGAGAENLLNPNQITGSQIAGDALQLGTTIASAGTYGTAAKGAETGVLLSKASKVPTAVSTLTKTTGVLKGIGVGALKGAGEGALIGGSTGVSQGLKNDMSGSDIVQQGVEGAIGGGVTGGVLGAITGGISGYKNNKALRQEVLNAQEKAGLRPAVDPIKITERASTDPKFKYLVDEAKKQGYTEKDINFLSTVAKEDKPVMKKMFDLTVKAQSDPRQITRAADVLGDTVTGHVKQVQGLNSQAGKAVDLTAKALRGVPVDVAPLEQSIISKLDNAGIAIGDNGTLDFSQSVFKNTPEIQKEIQKVISSAPDGSDAYQLHIFKKSIDEMVNYGTAGEGLSGSSANILKSIRNSADDVLDKNFKNYNEANTVYKYTRDFIDQAKEVAGKKVDLSTPQGSQAFGQSLRSAFSNNKSRGNVLKFIEDTQSVAKQLGLKGSKQNILDQAIYVDLLEQTFGSQATTGLAGETTKAIKKASELVAGGGSLGSKALNVAMAGIDKLKNISPEEKQLILKAFIK